MTAPSPAQEEAERLLPDWPMGRERVRHYVEMTRPAVAVALQALTDEIDARDERIKVLEAALKPFAAISPGRVGAFVSAMAGRRLKALHGPDEHEASDDMEAMRALADKFAKARTALNQPVPASTGAKHDGGVG